MEPFAGRAWVLARRARGEADLSVALLLEDGSVRWTTARAGAKSSRRFGAGLSPFTRYRVRFQRGGIGGRAERLDEATVDRAFAGLHTDLRRLGAAGMLSAYARDLGGELAEDDALFVAYDAGIARIEHAGPHLSGAVVVGFVVEAFARAGHEVVRDRCARCGREVPAGRSVTFAVEAGGVRCAACGGGPFVLRAAERAALEAVIAGGDDAFAPWMLRWIAYVSGEHAARGRECVLASVAYW
jgi:DNA repair protein RecO (recombination protein O)